MASNKNTRIESIDFIRGVAVLGILVMNSLIFALPVSAYFNHSSEGAIRIYMAKNNLFSKKLMAPETGFEPVTR